MATEDNVRQSSIGGRRHVRSRVVLLKECWNLCLDLLRENRGSRSRTQHCGVAEESLDKLIETFRMRRFGRPCRRKTHRIAQFANRALSQSATLAAGLSAESLGFPQRLESKLWPVLPAGPEPNIPAARSQQDTLEPLQGRSTLSSGAHRAAAVAAVYRTDRNLSDDDHNRRGRMS